MINDYSFLWYNSGSAATSAATAHSIYGEASGGLSGINANEVVIIQIVASGGDLRLSANPAVAATDDIGLFVGVAASVIDLPPMLRTYASQVTFARESANNPTIQWVIWRRIS